MVRPIMRFVLADTELRKQWFKKLSPLRKSFHRYRFSLFSLSILFLTPLLFAAQRAKLPLVDQLPNHHRGLLLKLNSAVSFVRVPYLDPKPDHHDLSRIKFVVLVVENGEFLTQIEGGEVHCRTSLSFREIATDRFSVLEKNRIVSFL
ncbi:hypothetical protein ACFX2J_023227 [Malus domestica]